MTSIVRSIAILATAALIAGCSSTKQPAYEPSVGLNARMTGTGSTATGAFRVYDAKDGSGVNVQLTLINSLPGTYLITLHERGNCKSPNLFSAGPAWAPPGSGKAPGDLLPTFSTDSEGDLHNYGAFIRGVHVDGPDGLVGKLVVVQFGRGVSDAEPGLPNKRMACGVLEYIKPVF
jgi:Cu/Zn superoxide dismutase